MIIIDALQALIHVAQMILLAATAVLVVLIAVVVIAGVAAWSARR